MKSKRIIAAFIAAVLLLTVTGCEQRPEKRTEATEPSYAYLAQYQNEPCYRELEPRLQKAYSAVYEAMIEQTDQDGPAAITGAEGQDAEKSYGINIMLPVSLTSKEEVALLYTSFTRDNPQFFFIGRLYRCEGYHQDGRDYYDSLYLSFTMSAAERLAAKESLAAAVQKLTAGLPAATETDTELVLHDRLIANCQYDKQALEEGADAHPNAYTAFGALVGNSAVCEGYARGMQLLLKSMNIPCTLVTGASTEDGRSHMWDLVTVDGGTYHLDATWNDPDDRPIHTYFNLTDDQIRLSHTIDEINPGIAPSSTEELGYYRFTGRYLSDRNTDVVDVAIAGAIREKYAVIDLQFSADAYKMAKPYIANATQMAKNVNTLLADDKLSLWDYEYLTDDIYCTITIYKIAK